MMAEQFIDQPVAVQTRLASDGRPQPVALAWQGHRLVIRGLGRQWPEEREGELWQCWLAETAAGEVIDLRWQPDRQEWRLWRIWQRSSLA